MNLINRLNAHPLTHRLIRQLHLRPMANIALGLHPLVRTLPSGVKYRCRYLDTIALAEDIFRKRVYAAGVPRDVETFADVGCNVGQFVAFLADHTGRRGLRGLAVDASRNMVKETEWVIESNGMDGVAPILGLVGGAAGEMGDFYLHPVSLLSSRFAEDEPGQPKKGDFTRIRVPFLDLEAVWRGMLGDVPCDLVKIDIEGSEKEFVAGTNPFFRRARRIVIETHKWVVSPEEIQARLSAMGFVKRGVLDETGALEVAYYVRQA